MAAKNIVLQLALRAYEKALQLGQSVQVSVKKSVDLAKETRKEIQAGIRERIAAARLLGQQARSDLLRREASSGDLKTRAEALQAASRASGDSGKGLKQAFGKADRAAGVLGALGGNITASTLAGLLPQAAIIGLAAVVLDRIRAEVQRQVERDVNAIVERLRLDLDRRFRTFEERIRLEPAFRAVTALRAGDELQRQRARQEGLGLTREGLDAVLLPEDD